MDKQTVVNIVNDPITAKVVAASTISSGAMSMLDLIPDNIGKLATLIGIILSVVLILVHLGNIKKLRLEAKKLELEIAEKTKASEVEEARQQAGSLHLT